MARPADPNARSALVAAARAVFARKGIKGARVEDITAACGLSKGAFYLHFETKEAVFAELLQDFMGKMARSSEARLEKMTAFGQAYGALGPKDFQRRTPRYQKLLELETQLDCEALEAMWEHRDVLAVLLTGSHGTEFEGLLWTIVDTEIARVAADFHKLQGSCACRTDVTPELFATMAVGTFLLVGKQLARAEKKPDLRLLAKMIHRLIHEGAMPGRGPLEEGPVPRFSELFPKAPGPAPVRAPRVRAASRRSSSRR